MPLAAAVCVRLRSVAGGLARSGFEPWVAVGAVSRTNASEPEAPRSGVPRAPPT